MEATCGGPPPPLWAWQKAELERYANEPKRAIFASPRLGKSRVILESLPMWRAHGVTRVLIVAPLIVCPQWARWLESGDFRVINLYSGSREARARRLSGAEEGVAVANYDILGALDHELAVWSPAGLVGDESHLLKGVATTRAKVFRRLGWHAQYVRLLTGTPTPNHYGDLWGQLVALDRTEWGKSYEKFAQRYLIRDTMFRNRVLGHRNVEELQERLLRYASIVRREDAFGPDTWQVVTRRVDLPRGVRPDYDRFAREWLLELPEGEVEAAHILKRLVRLQQFTSGFLPLEDGTVKEVHRAKVEAVLADLEEIVESGEKAVIFHRFRWESETYVREVEQRYSDSILGRINGDTSAADRARQIDEFNNARGPRIMVLQTQAGGVGISLAEATHALFVSRGFSSSDDQQARDRIYRPGARRCVTYYQVERTVDSFIADVLARKETVHEAVTHADHKAMAYGFI